MTALMDQKREAHLVKNKRLGRSLRSAVMFRTAVVRFMRNGVDKSLILVMYNKDLKTN